ncbi:eukaryotic translation initiation factor 3 135 kDa subunit [Sodiomyces alkalinus F11]|uniref:Clustered mitochondria protein homolog n=1 Tax=Sodiomyces alkalinus (strain CBS 110278 / VKM F-3762 / F11) TaxID=1314773 RepID=A0A3N2Q0D3_SODAK|nr:eukaryotic translation initiation factor 3 135 kDa subunit [Sodiomyces alkalinus F11]ROT40146.1 eukaryotic translation initiation factor 3 135 kDa subunit [Sodiomyces alkalinus F11]
MATVSDEALGSTTCQNNAATANPTPETPSHHSEAVVQDGEQAHEALINLTIHLPHEPRSMNILVSPHEQVHEVRQSVIDLPAAFRYTCFHLEYQGSRVNDFLPVSEVISPDQPHVTLVQDPYTEKEARIHLVRIRELIGASGDRTDLVQGISPGLSLLDTLNTKGDEAVQDNREDDLKQYEFRASASVTKLLPPEAQEAPKTVKSICLSSWNPPPCHLRQRGHLLYLVVATLEGEQHHITSHVGGFYVNKSSNGKFDPQPKPPPKGHAAHSLLHLLSFLSPSFEAAFRALQQFNTQRDPLATIQIANALPAAPWVVPPTVSLLSSHVSDPTRSQETYLLAGGDNTDTLRDWNEELQSARELPKETVQDRVFRERLISKLFADYNDAATRGAIMVARGEIQPLNPTECEDAQIFVYNNIFFSFGADGVGTFTSEGGDEAARVATAKDVSGVRLVNQLDIDGLYTTATVVVDYLGKRIVAQSIVPGIFKPREPGENQIDYGAVEGKDVVAADERFIAVFEKLSRDLKVKQHPVWNKDGQRVDLETSVETKGLMGTDGRKYVLDLYRVTPLDVGWLEISTKEGDFAEYPHRMTVLRPELINSFCRKKMKEWVDAELARRGRGPKASPSRSEKAVGALPDVENPSTAATDETSGSSGAEKDDDHIDLSKFSFSLNPDVFSGQDPQTDEDRRQLEADEKDVRLACHYLTDEVIPELLRELKECETSFPMDGQALSRLLHKRGINIRYLGRVASLSTDPSLQCLRNICVQDMIARSFKHIASAYLRQTPAPLTSSCVAHLLNCLLGVQLNPAPVPDIDPSLKALYLESDFSFETVTPYSLRSQVVDETWRRFRYRLEDLHRDIKPLQLLRDISLKLGLQLQAKDYVFAQIATDPPAAPEAKDQSGTPNSQTNGESKKKKKKNRDMSPMPGRNTEARCTFWSDDIVNIVPIVKHSSPRSALAEEALEAGRISILQSQRKLGQELLLESLSLHEQIYGVLHPEVARVYNTLSMLYYQLDEKEAAVELARKAIIVSERTVGIDSAETLLNYLNLSLFLHQTGDSKGALMFAKHALDLWNIIYGPDHPDSITTINNGAVMLQHLKAYHHSRLWFEESLRVCEQVFGKGSINAATLLFQLAQALALDQDSKGAVNRMRESYSIFLSKLGPEDKNTKEAENWLEQLTQNAVSIAKHAKDVQNRRLRPGVRFPGEGPFNTASHSQASPSTFQKSPLTTTPNIDSRSIDDLIKFIEGNDQANMTSKRPSRGNPKRRGEARAV